MKIAITSLLVLLTAVPTYAGPLCNGIIDRVVEGVDPPFPFQCECGLRIFRRVRFNCETEVCLDQFDGFFGAALPFTLPIIYNDSTCLNPSFRGRFPKRANGDIDVGGCTGRATMVVDMDQLVKNEIDNTKTASDFGLPATLDFDIPNSCLDVTTNGRPGARDPSISLSSCTASVGGTACPCSICAGGSGIEIGAECVQAIFDSMIPPEISNNSNQDIVDKFTFTATSKCIGGDNLFTGRGVVDIMLTPYLS